MYKRQAFNCRYDALCFCQIQKSRNRFIICDWHILHAPASVSYTHLGFGSLFPEGGRRTCGIIWKWIYIVWCGRSPFIFRWPLCLSLIHICVVYSAGTLHNDSQYQRTAGNICTDISGSLWSAGYLRRLCRLLCYVWHQARTVFQWSGYGVCTKCRSNSRCVPVSYTHLLVLEYRRDVSKYSRTWLKRFSVWYVSFSYTNQCDCPPFLSTPSV